MIRRAGARAVLDVLGQRAYERLRARAVARKIRAGRWREPELELLPHLVAPGDVVVDVGANFGLYCFHLSRLVGPEGRVLAFEPVPSTCMALRRVLRTLGLHNVDVREQAVTDAPGWADMTVPRRADGSIDSGRAWVSRTGAPAEGEPVHVRATRLDDVLAAEADVSLVKCDVEGAELFALRGATGLLGRCAPTLVLEVSNPAMQRYGLEPVALAELLGGQGYRTYRYDADRGRLLPTRPGDTDENVVAVHPRRSVPLAALLT